MDILDTSFSYEKYKEMEILFEDEIKETGLLYQDLFFHVKSDKITNSITKKIIKTIEETKDPYYFMNGLGKHQDWFPSNGYYEVIKTMIKYGYDITKSDILHSVYPYGDPRWYMFLILLGAPYDIKDDNNRTPIDRLNEFYNYNGNVLFYNNINILIKTFEVSIKIYKNSKSNSNTR